MDGESWSFWTGQINYKVPFLSAKLPFFHTFLKQNIIFTFLQKNLLDPKLGLVLICSKYTSDASQIEAFFNDAEQREANFFLRAIQYLYTTCPSGNNAVSKYLFIWSNIEQAPDCTQRPMGVSAVTSRCLLKQWVNGGTLFLMQGQQWDGDIPANTWDWTNVGLEMAHRLRRWPNIKAVLNHHFGFQRELFWLQIWREILVNSAWPHLLLSRAKVSMNRISWKAKYWFYNIHRAELESHSKTINY